MKKKIIIATLSVLILATLNGCSNNETSTANSSKADNSSSSVNKMVVDITEEKQTTTTTQPSETTTSTAEVVTEQPVKEGEGPTGNPTPQQIEDSMNTGSVIPTPPEIYVNPEPSVDPSQNNSVFDAQMYEKLGVEVVLPGGNDANAQALYNALKAKHPTLPWKLNGNSVRLDRAAKEDLIDYSLTDEEIDSSLAEWLAGRDYHSITLEEWFEHSYLCWGTKLGVEIDRYFSAKAGHIFTSGGMVVGW